MMQNNSTLKAFTLLLCIIISYIVLLKTNYLPADFNTYNLIYSSTYDKMSEIEVGFLFLSKTFFNLGVDYVFFAMFICSACLIIKVRTLQKMLPASSGLCFLFIYFCFFSFLHELTQLRLAIATTFCYIAIYYTFFLPNKKRAIFWGIGAMFFHYSIIFLFFAFFINNRTRFFWFIVVAIFIFMGANSHLVSLVVYMPNEKIAQYLYRVSQISSSSSPGLNLITLNNLIYVFVYLGVALLRGRLNLSVAENKMITTVQYSSLIGFVLFVIFNAVPVIAFRIPELLRITYPLVLAIMLKRSVETRVYNILTPLIVFLLSCSMLFVTIRAVAINYA